MIFKGDGVDKDSELKHRKNNILVFIFLLGLLQ